MIHDHEKNNSQKASEEVTYTSPNKHTLNWYEQNGKKRMTAKNIKLVSPRKAVKIKPVTTPTQSKPSMIESLTEKPVEVKEPSFTVSKPVEVGEFVFEKVAPVRAEVTVPQPPPAPGPAPTFNIVSKKNKAGCEYQYGIKSLEIKHLQYETKSVYVSTPITAVGNVMQVSLEAIEEHPVFDELNGQSVGRQTSIEYYIAPVGKNGNPTLEDWMPILPEGVTEVESELLFFESGLTSELRFPALIGSKKRPVVYRNGIPMDSNDWAFADGGAKMRLLVSKEPTSIYTIDYTPNAEYYNPWFLDVNQDYSEANKQRDVFEQGTNHNKTIVLSKYPFINYELVNADDNYNQNTSVYTPIQVYLKDASISGVSRQIHKEVLPYQSDEQVVFTKNNTNYKTGYHDPLRVYSTDPDKRYQGFEYYHEGQKLYFTETFNKATIQTNFEESHGNASIVVDYEYLSSDFRVKIILRRNSTDENTLTPIVHDYKLKFKVMK